MCSYDLYDLEICFICNEKKNLYIFPKNDAGGLKKSLFKSERIGGYKYTFKNTISREEEYLIKTKILKR